MLLLVRHGQSSLNAEGRLAGRLDVGLTPHGERQAAALAAAVETLGEPDLLVTSPLARARQTAAAFRAAATVDERWIELDYGELDGCHLRDVPATLWQTWRSDPDFSPPGGESLRDVSRRVRTACTDLVDQAETGLVVVVTHVSPIKAAVAWALAVPDSTAWRMFVAPASVTRISVREADPSLHGFNDTSHLRTD